ncbi:hypothetical protein GOODEAATRI_011650, partial [Goodea atripinnis]
RCSVQGVIFSTATGTTIAGPWLALSVFRGRMAGMNGDRKGKKDDNGIGTAIDFMLSNAKLVLGVGGAAVLGIATLAVKRVSEMISVCHCSGYLTHV